MFRRILGVFMIGSCLVVPGIASAQERSPHTGSTAVGVDVGAFIPSADELESALIVNALFDYYVTPRVSLRTVFGLTDPGFSQESSDSLRQIPLRLDVNYNWEGGRWHPFVGTGVGAYFLQLKNNGRPAGDRETKFGFNLGGGVEYFLGPRVAVKGEGRYHMIEDAESGFDPSGLGLSIGVKTYF